MPSFCEIATSETPSRPQSDQKSARQAASRLVSPPDRDPTPRASANVKAAKPSQSVAPSGRGPKPSPAAASSKTRAPLPTRQPKPATTASGKPVSSALSRIALPLDKMATAVAGSPGSVTPDGPKISMTSKEWIVPRRPKPGRKPATDAPPTKRKAQNRAAQRAFRERRAARVGELEQQLDEQRESHEKQNACLQDRVRELELDLQSFRSRCSLLESMLERERQDCIRAETQAKAFALKRGERADPLQTGNERATYQHAPAGLHRPSMAGTQRNSLSMSHQLPSVDGGALPTSIVTPPDTLDLDANPADAALTCGNCSPTSGSCACADEVLASATNGCDKCQYGAPCECLEDIVRTFEQAHLKRPPSPLDRPRDDKRPRSSLRVPLKDAADLTSNTPQSASGPAFQQSPYQPLISDDQGLSGDLLSFRDSCGFCRDGTYCVCADDAAAAAAAAAATTPSTPSILTPTPSTDALPPIIPQTQTPPPSESDSLTGASNTPSMEITADGAVKLPSRKQPRPHQKPTINNPRGCGANGPGTCAQCQADPKSSLFCRLMAAKFDCERPAPPDACCGNKGPDGGCCRQSAGGAAAKERVTLPSLPSLGLSCAEAYQTLSSHRNFDLAADDINSWLSKLKATAPGDGGRSGARRGMRPAIEVEAASIMSVLKEFDVRFGREC